jgi:glycosyltransferase involved in cell wall biosynthesis
LNADGLQKLRVLHVIDSFDLGGAQTALLNLLRELDPARHVCEVACMHGRGVFWPEFEALQLPVHSLSPSKYAPFYLPRLAGLIARFRPHVVHCHLFGSNWIAKPLAALLGVPVRVNHDQCNDALRYESRAAFWLDRWTNRFSSHVCAVSRSTRDFLVRDEGLSPDRVSVVYNGVDLRRFEPPASRPQRAEWTVLGVGRLTDQKNFALFLEVLAGLSAAGVPVRGRIAGTGPQEHALRAQARALGLEKRVEFLGHVTDTARLYAEADALLMPSRFEGTPLTALEAMAMRLPIVASRLDGLAEVLDSGRDALLVEPGDREGFVRALHRLWQEPALGEALAGAAFEKAQTEYSARVMATRVESVYERCFREARG